MYGLLTTARSSLDPCALHKSFEVDARRRISSGRRDSDDENRPVIQQAVSCAAVGEASSRALDLFEARATLREMLQKFDDLLEQPELTEG